MLSWVGNPWRPPYVVIGKKIHLCYYEELVTSEAKILTGKQSIHRILDATRDVMMLESKY